MASKNYVVNISNIGNIEAASLKKAIELFNEYVKQSKTKNMRASGEDVFLFSAEGEIIKEYFGTNQD